MSTAHPSPELVQEAVNTIRFLAVDAVEKAKSGHPGMPMGAAAMAYTLWHRFLRHNPADPAWPNRDRFVLSAGHGSMLLYSLLHLTGYDLSREDLAAFRQWGSKTPGHPEHGHTPGVETTTGPLGQGLATAVGMAMGRQYLNRLFATAGGPLFDYRIFGIVGDGDLMEGVASEAASLAGHLGLDALCFLYDDNRITIEGGTDLAFSEDVRARFLAYGWQVETVADGNDVEEVAAALTRVLASPGKPSLVMVRTHIGFGSPARMDSPDAHGAPLGPEESRRTKEALGWPLEPTFLVPAAVAAHLGQARENGQRWQAQWQERLAAVLAADAEAAALWQRLMAGELPAGWEARLPDFAGVAKLATRQASGQVINALAPVLPELLGGSADLAPSNNTAIKGGGDFTRTAAGRVLRFGVREHAMAACLNGLALSGLLIPFGGTFLVFSDYMKPAMRLSALMGQRVIYILTHDSIGLGEDGPTHQPIGQLAALRAMPNLVVIRPADARETAAAWRVALGRRQGPTALILSRQALPVLDGTSYPAAGAVERGAYILAEAGSGSPALILLATGSEVALALEARSVLEGEGVPTRVVSMPSWELFDAQPPDYRQAVLPPAVRSRLAVEAASTLGWERYVGLDGAVLGMTTFGASAPGPVLLERFGLTVAGVVARAKSVLQG
ncbi:MAG: transketolase [Thermodesulfobacteriota bacterium]